MNIPQSTFDFLNQLRENNNREWFQANRELFDAARLQFMDFAEQVLHGLVAMDKRIPEDIPVSKCVYRIYRDIRFSLDKTPYKGYFSAAYSPTGRSTELPGYYIHIQPGQSFATAGLWHPSKERLAAIRQEIDYNSADFRSIVEAPLFLQHAGLDQEDRLKKAPSGYSADHPDIEFLRLKSFTATKSFSDNEMMQADATEMILSAFQALQPFQEFLYQAVEEV